jgi:hypothetical protein
MTDRACTLATLTIHEICAALLRHTFNTTQTQTRLCLEDAVYALPPDVFSLLARAASNKMCHSESASSGVLEPVPANPPPLPFSFPSSSNLSANTVSDHVQRLCP